MKGHAGRGQGHTGSLGRDSVMKGGGRGQQSGIQMQGLISSAAYGTTAWNHLHCCLLKQQSLAQNVTNLSNSQGKQNTFLNKQQGRERAQKAGAMSFTKSWENEQGQSLSTSCSGPCQYQGHVQHPAAVTCSTTLQGLQLRTSDRTWPSCCYKPKGTQIAVIS